VSLVASDRFPRGWGMYDFSAFSYPIAREHAQRGRNYIRIARLQAALAFSSIATRRISQTLSAAGRESRIYFVG
jgi:hypothetical protein